MSKDNRERQLPQPVEIPVEWHIGDQIKSNYADNVVVQARKHDIIISFFETQLPPFGGTPEDNRTFLETLSSIRAECIGRIVVAPELVPEIIKALQTGYDGYLSSKSTERSAND